jgi:hypothetical protein
MDDRTAGRLVDQLAGDGWILSGGVPLAPVTYAVNVYEVRTVIGDHVATGTEFTVRLLNHTLRAAHLHGQPVTLRLHDGRQIAGFLSDDGAQLVRTGALA